MRESPQSFTLKAGQYVFDVYGAQGGSGYLDGVIKSQGGLGAHVKATLNVTGTGTLFYAYVGEQGSSSQYGPNKGGWNGGGKSGKDTEILKGDAAGGGGGATDVRIYDQSFSNRVIVAAGGSGGAGDENGAPGGDTSGRRKTGKGATSVSLGTNQNKGNTNGVGGTGIDSIYTPGSGGGGGWRGGVSSEKDSGYKDIPIFGKWIDYYNSVADGGSSYVSGHNECTETQSVRFTDIQFEVGKRSGNGYLTVTTVFECSENCGSCSNFATCHSCFNDKKLYDNKCIPDCPEGTYEVGFECKDCPTGCKECNSLGTCSSCLQGYYKYASQCYSDCTTLNNAQSRSYFGKDNTIGECKECQDSNCVDCSDDYSRCKQCSDLFKLDDSGLCILKETDVFTKSSPFTSSMRFTDSSVFTRSSQFTDSSVFTQTSQFSASSIFTQSSPFTRSSVFTRSSKFTASSVFTRSSQFTASSAFTASSHFTPSSSFSPSSLFSSSDTFTFSSLFTQSSVFTASSEFTSSLPFTKSSTFTRSKRFTRSNKFTKSSPFTHSSLFTDSLTFSQEHHSNDVSLSSSVPYQSTTPSVLVLLNQVSLTLMLI